MYVLTTDEMKGVEKYAIDEMGVPSIVLMENAAKNAAEIILSQCPQKVTVFAGKGNNGGDGLAVARHLITNGVRVKIYFIGERNRATPDCEVNLSILEKYNCDISYGYRGEDLCCDIIVDSLIGTGLKRQLSDEYAYIVSKINNSDCRVAAIDCPTGINSDTGEDYGIAVNADITVTFHCPKVGLMLYPAYSHAGKIYVRDIGIPYVSGSNTFIIDDISMPKRNPDSHKGTYGKAIIAAGSELMTGAAVLNCKAAYKVGAGLVKLCSVDRAIDVIHQLLPEALTQRREDMDYDYGNVCALGSGLGINKELVSDVIKNYRHNIIIDADGLNSIADDTDILKCVSKRCVITPHIMEMSRLTGYDVKYIKNNLIAVAKEFALRYNIIVVLKDSHSIITDGNTVCINTAGTPAMSKGGTGDCLCGVITGLAAQGEDLFDSACKGCFIMGKAGERAARRLGEYSVMATDIIEEIPNVIKEVVK